MAQLVSFKSLAPNGGHNDNDNDEEETISSNSNNSNINYTASPAPHHEAAPQTPTPTQTPTPAPTPRSQRIGPAYDQGSLYKAGTPNIGLRKNSSDISLDILPKFSATVSRSLSPMEPTKHFEIKWRDIDLRTKVRGNPCKELLFASSSSLDDDTTSRKILTNLSGSVYSGQLTAILGPSGVGKTTLLNCLTGRNNLEGTGLVKVIGGISKRIAVCTIPQDDILPSHLSVKEDLYFTSKLKNPYSDFNHDKNVSRVARLLQVEKCFNTRIGKLSGGETRRLSIARELLSNPDLMILDEPTSGLDANTCWKIISALRSLVEHSDNELDRPMAMIVTIHQPQREVLDLFHRIYVMAQGGHAIYEGPPSSLMSVLVDQTRVLKKVGARLNENPAIVAMEVASGEYGDEAIRDLADYHISQLFEEECAGSSLAGSLAGTPRSMRHPKGSPLSVSPRIALRQARSSPLSVSPRFALRQGANQSLQHQLNQDYVSTVTFFSNSSDEDIPPNYSKVKVDRRLRRSVILKSHFWRHTWTLMGRAWLLTTRNIFLMSLRIIGFVMVGMGIVQIFAGALKDNANLCPNFASEVDNIGQFMTDSLARIGTDLVEHHTQARSTHLFFFHTILCLMMVTAALTGLIFPLQMRIFLRERKNGWYSLGSFMMSHTLAELPIDIIGPLITIAIVYPTCHQPRSYLEWRYLAYTLTCILASLICKSQAQIVGGLLMSSVENSVFVSCVMVAPQALLSGIAVRIADMYHFLQLLSYGTFLRYAFDCLFILRYGFGQCPCDPNKVDGFPTRPSEDAVPPQLENLARGLIDLTKPSSNGTTTIQPTNDDQNLIESTTNKNQTDDLFTVLVDLVSQANNIFVANGAQLGSCDTYNSLYLIERDIGDKHLIPWLCFMVFMFVVSRFITYYILLMVMKYHG